MVAPTYKSSTEAEAREAERQRQDCFEFEATLA